MTQVLTISISIEVPDGAVVAATTSGGEPAVVPGSSPVPHAAPARPGPTPDGYRLGSAQAAVLNALADRHGRLVDPTGHAVKKLAELAGSPSVNQCAGVVRKLDELGLLERTLPSARRTSRIVLTPAGWEAIGRRPVRAEDIVVDEPAPAAEPAPAMPVLGGIERRPFDPDRVRENGASAL